MTQLEVIWKFMAALDKTTKTNSKDMLDEAIQSCSDYSGIDDARQQFLAAAKAASNSTTFLAECGINISNSDTGGITGADAGGSVTKTSNTTVYEIANTYTANSSATAPQSISTGSNGWHVKATGFDDTIISGGEDSVDAGAGSDFIQLDGRKAVILTGGDNDTISVGSGVKFFTVKDYVAGKTVIRGAENFDSVLSVNSDGTSTVKFTLKGFTSNASEAESTGAETGGEIIIVGETETDGITFAEEEPPENISIHDENAAVSYDAQEMTAEEMDGAEAGTAASVDLSKVTTLKGYFNGSGNFVGNSTLSSGDFLGNVTSEFDPSFLDVDASGNLSFTFNGLRLNIKGERDPSSKSLTYAINAGNISTLSDVTKTTTTYSSSGAASSTTITRAYQYNIIAGLYKWWFKESLQLNEEATGLGFATEGVTVNEIDLYFENYTAQNWLAYVSSSYDTDNGKTVKLTLVINEKFFYDYTNENESNAATYVYTESSRTGNRYGGTLDRTIAHEFNHAVFAANVNYFSYLPMFLKEGMAELVHGVDDSRKNPIQTLLNNTVNNNSAAWLDDYLSMDIRNSSQASTLKGGGSSYPYAAGYMFLRWLAKTASDASNAEIFSSDKLSARVELRTDGIYYISGKSTDLTTARVISFDSDYSGVSVGSASGNTYTLNSAIKQIVTYFNDQSSWNISGVGSNVTIVADDSAAGGDSITGSGSFALIRSGAGNDTISLTGAQNSITGGAGNDVIYSSGSANIFSYTEGDGSDVIYNFSANDTLEVAGKSCATVASGSDVIVKVGSGSVTLKNAAGKTLHIKADEVKEPVCKIGSVMYTSLEDAISAAASGDTITLTENLELTGTVTIPAGKNLTLELAGKTVTSTAYAALSYGGYLTINDGSYNHTGSINGATYALQKTGSGTLTINDDARDIAAAWEISGTTAIYKAAGKTAGYAISSDGKTFGYSAASGCETLATITGLNSGASTEDISLRGTEITLAAAALNKSTVTISDGYTLKLASDVTTPESTAAHWEISNGTANYISESFSAGYVLENNQIVYNSARSGETLITITGLKNNASTEGIKLDGTKITLGAATLGADTVTVSEGYTLALAEDVEVSEKIAAHWEFDGNTVSYADEGNTSGYILINDGTSIRYVSESGGEILFTITGLIDGAPVDGVSVDGTEVTLSASVLGADTVSISAGYSLKLAGDVQASKTTPAHWDVADGLAQYFSDYVSAGYAVNAAGTVSYVQESGGDFLILVTGLNSGATNADISLKGTEVVISAAALDSSIKVGVSSGYTLALADDVQASKTTPAHWDVADGLAQYFSEYKTAGYAVNDDGMISYFDEGGGEFLILVTGLSSSATNADISLSGNEVVLKAAALDKNISVSVSSGYTLALADDVQASQVTPAHWEVASGKANYISEQTSAGYVVNDDGMVSYVEETGGDSLIQVTGLSTSATDADISLKGYKVTLAAAALNQQTVTITDGYTLVLASDVALPETTPAHWEIADGAAKYLAEYTSAGYVVNSNGTIGYETETGGETLVTVTGLSSSATVNDISLSGNEITLTAAALNKQNVTVTSGYTLKLAEDVTTPETTPAHWEVASGTAKYISEYTSAGYVVNANGSISYAQETGGEDEITITGLSTSATENDFSQSGSEITLTAAALNQQTVTITSGYTLKLADDVTTSSTTPAYWEIDSGTANYISEYKTAGYSLNDDGTVSYIQKTGGDISVTVTGLSASASDADISIDGTEITLTAAALDQSTVTVTRGYSLKLASDVAAPETTAEHWEISNGTANYISEHTSAGYVVNSNGSVSYAEETGGEILTTVTGLSSSATDESISLSRKIITLSEAALGKEPVSATNGYSLKLASDVTKPEVTAAHWEVSNGTARYISEYTSAGYVLDNDGTISYAQETGGETVTTVTGLNSSATASDISLSGTEITIKAAALNQTSVSATNGYSLKLASNVVTPEVTAAHWEIASGTANYISEHTSAGYVENENGTVSYNTETGGTTQITVTGLRSNAPASGISLSGTEVTLAASTLGQSAVAISTGYTLKLGSDVTVPTDIAAYWFISGTSASYRAPAKSSGYVVASDGRSITYAATSGGNTLTIINGLKRGVTVDEISLKGTEVTLAADALNQRTVSITGNYTLKLAADVVTPYVIASHWTVSGTTANYIDDITTAGYVLEEDAKSISYNTQTGGETLVTVTGLKSGAPVSGISLNGNEVTLKSTAVGEGAVSISSGYSLVIGSGNYNGLTTLKGGANDDTLTSYGNGVMINSGGGADLVTNRGMNTTVDAGAGNDSITSSAYNVSLNGGAGNDVVSLGGNLSSVTVTGGSGNDTIYGDSGRHVYTYAKGDGSDEIFAFNERDSLQITSGSITKTDVSGNDVTFTVNTGTVTIKDAKGKKITTLDATGNASTYVYDENKTFDENKTSVTLASTFQGTLAAADYYSTVQEIDGSEVTSAIQINGNARANTITGGSKADYISGGSGADIIYGGTGADTLSGDAGDDTLTGGDGADTFLYNSGGGNDFITDFTGGTDKIKLASGSVDSIGFNKSDLVFKVGKGSFTIADGKDKKITLVDADGNSSTYIYGDNMTYNENKTSVTLASNFRGTLNSSDYSMNVLEINASPVKNITRIIGNTLANTIYGGTRADTILGGGSDDSISGNAGKDILYGGIGNDALSGGIGDDTLYGETGNDTLTGGAGKDVFVYSNGDGDDIITDYVVGQDRIKLASGSIISTSVKGSDVVMKIGTGTLTVQNAKDKKIVIADSKNKTLTQIYGSAGTYNENKTAITLASNLTGTLNASDYDSAVAYIDGTRVANAIRIGGNAKANTILGGAKADYISGGGGGDIIDGGAGNDTLAGGAGNDTLTGGDGSNVFVYGSGEGNDIITDYNPSQDKISLASGTISSASIKGSDIVLKVGNSSVTVKDGKDKKISVIDASGTTTARIYTTGMTYDENKSSVTLASNFRGTLKASDYASSVSVIDASHAASALKIFGNDKTNTITGTSKADCISGGANGDLLIGGSGNDTLNGDKGNDTLTGGKGNDFFAYSDGDGNDLITDYTVGQDKIKILSGSVESASINGSDVVLKVGSGSVKIENAKDKKVSIIDASKQTTTYIYSDGLTYDENKTSATLYSAFTGTLSASDYASTVKVIDASSVANAVKIIGTSKANTIYGGTKADSLNGGGGNDLLIGGAGNDTLNGDKGNDTLTGGAGNDIFFYAEGDGNDAITDYTAGQDIIKLASGSISSAALSGNNVVFKIGSNSLTLRNAANTSIRVLDANNKYATYSLSGGVSGSNGYWFTENNFGDAQLDSIMETSADYSAANVETPDAENIAQISLAAYTQDK